MTSFLSTNITPAINGFFDWMNVLCDKLTIGSAQLYFYSTENKTLSTRNVLQVNTHGDILEWISNDSVVHTLANSVTPVNYKNFFVSSMAYGTLQSIVIADPVAFYVVDPVFTGASNNKNQFAKIAGDVVQYTGAPNRGFNVNISGTASTIGGGGTIHKITLTFKQNATIIASCSFTCVDTTEFVNFNLSTFAIVNTWEGLTLNINCDAPLTVGLQDLTINITEF